MCKKNSSKKTMCKNNSWKIRTQTSWVVLEIRTHPDRGGGLKIGDFGGRPLLTGEGWFWNFGRFRTGEGGL